MNYPRLIQLINCGRSKIDRRHIEEIVSNHPVRAVAREIIEPIHLSPDLVGVERIPIGEMHILPQIESVRHSIGGNRPILREARKELYYAMIVLGRFINGD